MKFKMTSLEKKWVLYDVGNSAFTLLVSTLIPIFFSLIAGDSEASATVYLGYATSIATAVVALLGPVLGAVSDLRGMRRRIFSIALLVGAVGCAVLGFIQHWIWFLALFVLAKSAYSLSLVVYDSMLCDVTTRERMDEVSSRGYAWGYIGSCVPFVACLVLILGCDSFGMTMGQAMTVSLIVIAAWWVAASIPLVRNYRQVHSVDSRSEGAFHTLARTVRNARSERKAFVFLVAFFFYIDGVYTIIEMATAYGQSMGLDTAMLLVALLVTQVVAFPFTIAFGRMSARFDTSRLIAVCIVAYMFITVTAFFMTSITQFFALAVMVGMFQGGIQALSRSHFSRIIPPERAGEFFGLMDIFGKGASFTGTLVVSAVSQLTEQTSLGILSLVALFVIGLALLVVSSRTPSSRDHSDATSTEAQSA